MLISGTSRDSTVGQPSVTHTPVSVHRISMALVLVCKGGSSVIYSLGTFVFMQQLFWQHETTTVLLPEGKYSSQHTVPVATAVQSRLDTGWCASEASGWGGWGSGEPGHRAKASAKALQERERAVHGTQNKICSIPSVSTLFQKMTYWTFPGIAVPSLSTVSWKYTQEKWLPSSRDLQKAWTGSRLQSVAEVVMLLHQLIQEQRMQGAWRKGCLFSLFSHQMVTIGREAAISFFQIASAHLYAYPYLQSPAVSR